MSYWPEIRLNYIFPPLLNSFLRYLTIHPATIIRSLWRRKSVYITYECRLRFYKFLIKKSLFGWMSDFVTNLFFLYVICVSPIHALSHLRSSVLSRQKFMFALITNTEIHSDSYCSPLHPSSIVAAFCPLILCTSIIMYMFCKEKRDEPGQLSLEGFTRALSLLLQLFGSFEKRKKPFPTHPSFPLSHARCHMYSLKWTPFWIYCSRRKRRNDMENWWEKEGRRCKERRKESLVRRSDKLSVEATAVVYSFVFSRRNSSGRGQSAPNLKTRTTLVVEASPKLNEYRTWITEFGFRLPCLGDHSIFVLDGAMQRND